MIQARAPETARVRRKGKEVMKHPGDLPRKRVRSDEDAVLINSRRRCCLCYFLAKDARRKDGQLAHINHKRSDSGKENLVWLCLPHHAEYDSRTSQKKNFTQKELHHYKAALEEAVNKGEIGIEGIQTLDSIKWARIEIAESSSWFEMTEVDGEDYTLFSYSWAGASGEGDLPFEVQTDPIFDVTLLNGSNPTILSRIGVIAKRSWQKLAGFPPPERITVWKEYMLDFNWSVDKPQWIRLDDPIYLAANAPFRYKLRLKGYAKTVPNNYSVINLVCQTDSGTIESDGICLST
jgi:hypothetical protein